MCTILTAMPYNRAKTGKYTTGQFGQKGEKRPDVSLSKTTTGFDLTTARTSYNIPLQQAQHIGYST